MPEYLNNEQVEKEAWEVLHIGVVFNGDSKGTVTTRFAYKDDITEQFSIKDDVVKLSRYYPKFVERQIKAKIKEERPTNKPKRKVREQPTHITIKRSQI